jgi:hypothetical protein
MAASLRYRTAARSHYRTAALLLHLCSYVTLLKAPEFTPEQLSPEQTATIKDAMALVSTLAKSVADQPQVAKNILVKTLTPVLPSMLQLLRVFKGRYCSYAFLGLLLPVPVQALLLLCQGCCCVSAAAAAAIAAAAAVAAAAAGI